MAHVAYGMKMPEENISERKYELTALAHHNQKPSVSE
jgi:hypothetical protein